jgi:hypothetical protein
MILFPPVCARRHKFLALIAMVQHLRKAFAPCYFPSAWHDGNVLISYACCNFNPKEH